MTRTETPAAEADLPLADKLLHRIEAYCKRAELSEARVANLAVNDGDFVRRLRDGRSCWLSTYEKFMAWLDDAERALEGAP